MDKRSLAKKSIEWLENRQKELEPARAEFYEISHILDRKYKEKKKADLARLKKETKYTPCEYETFSYIEDMGFEAVEGSAVFTSEEQAKALVNGLKAVSYYYGYVLYWDGPGKYTILPETGVDHDGETIYTAKFVKEKLNGY